MKKLTLFLIMSLCAVSRTSAYLAGDILIQGLDINLTTMDNFINASNGAIGIPVKDNTLSIDGPMKILDFGPELFESGNLLRVDYDYVANKPTLGTAAAQNSSAFAAASHTHAQSDVTGLVAALAGKEPSISSGTSAQYYRGDKSWATFPTNVSSFTNDAAYLTGISSGMVTTALGYTPYNGATNPNSYITQSGARSAISVTTTGSGAASYNSGTGVINIPTPPSSTFAIAAPSVGNALTSGVAFQPRSGGPCNVVVNTSVSGLIGVGGTVTIAMASTSGGTYSTVATDGIAITILGIGDRASCLIPVPTGYWLRVTNTPSGLATISNTYTRWDLS